MADGREAKYSRSFHARSVALVLGDSTSTMIKGLGTVVLPGGNLSPQYRIASGS